MIDFTFDPSAIDAEKKEKASKPKIVCEEDFDIEVEEEASFKNSVQNSSSSFEMILGPSSKKSCSLEEIKTKH